MSSTLSLQYENREPCQNPKATIPTQVSGGDEEENVPTPPEGEKTTETESVAGAKSVLTRVMRLAQRYLLDPMGRQRAEAKGSQAQATPRQRSPAPGRVFRSRTSSSLTQAQIRSRRRSQQRGVTQQPVVQGSSDVAVTDTAGRSDRSEPTLKRTGTGPFGKAAGRRSNHGLVQPVRVKSLRLLRSSKNPLSQTPPSSSVLPPSLRSSTLPPSSSIVPSQSPPSSSADQHEQHDTPRTALIK
ncbi:hypothetical protein VZT92_025074 [Zoarces viviparus]|uniref:Uncharacterized protein n=1 Tax=Zoarces viviparus TaxID=48416 RepID=A0AAW1E4Y5_ZOAVI